MSPLIAVGALALALSGCGPAASGAGNNVVSGDKETTVENPDLGPPDSNAESYDLPPFDFTAPPPGYQTTTEQSATDQLGFTLVVPPGVGTSTVTAQPGTPNVSVVYSESSSGPFWLDEAPSETDQKSLEALAGCGPSDGCQGMWEMTTLSDGTRALLITGGHNTALIWLNDGRRFDVIAPTSMTGKEASSIADAVQQASDK
jgi:hypothetical protein